ncbi:MAG: hypothetical protein LBM13_01500 [Candidatus Ancillula sp.]|jgi:hypothetical protein|nr:hypothetical protein [Candidatus Ancillula sp.]
MAKSNIDAEFAKIMLDNDVDKNLDEAQNSIKSAKEHLTAIDYQGPSESQKQRYLQDSKEGEFKSPGFEDLEPVGKKTYKKIIIGAVAVVLVIVGCCLFGSI